MTDSALLQLPNPNTKLPEDREYTPHLPHPVHLPSAFRQKPEKQQQNCRTP